MSRATEQAKKAIEEVQGIVPGIKDPAVPENVRTNLWRMLEERLAEAAAFLASAKR